MDNKKQLRRDIMNIPEFEQSNCTDINGACTVALSDSSAFASTVNEDDAVIGEWVATQLPEHEILPMTQVKNMIKTLCAEVNVLCRHPDARDLTVGQFRTFVLNHNPELKPLAKKCPHLYSLIVSKVGPVEWNEKLLFAIQLVMLREHHEQNPELSTREKSEQVSALFQQQFMKK
jgi:hypothetical protein